MSGCTNNMFNVGSELNIVKSVVELANFGIESADSNTDSITDHLKIRAQIQAFRVTSQVLIKELFPVSVYSQTPDSPEQR